MTNVLLILTKLLASFYNKNKQHYCGNDKLYVINTELSNKLFVFAIIGVITPYIYLFSTIILAYASIFLK